MKSSKGNISSSESSDSHFFGKKEVVTPFFQKKELPQGEKGSNKSEKDAGEINNTNNSPDMHSAIQSRAGKGNPLPSATRSKMESAFGTNFENVFIHNDTEAAVMSQNMNASAFTYGQDIYFGSNAYNPGTIEGDTLLAHELAHTVQQRGGRQVEEQSDSLLEADADQSAENFVISQNFESGKMGEQKVMPKSKTGLKISRCSRTSSGAMGPARRSTAVTNFRAKNTGLTAAELTKIESAMTLSTSGNINLEISFYDYYSNHAITKDQAITGRELAFTDPGSDTRVNPSVLDPAYPNNRLGDLLLHEYVHTRHDTNVMGMGDYQEGDAYATEYFFAERTGDTVRMGEILTLVSTSGGLTIPSLHASMQALFRKTYATLKILYQVIDTGTSPHPTSPLVTPTPITRDTARALVAELISVNATSRSPQLNGIVTWATANYGAIGIPPI